MEIFGEDQQQQALHPLGSNLQGRQRKQAHSYSDVLHIDLKSEQLLYIYAQYTHTHTLQGNSMISV